MNCPRFMNINLILSQWNFSSFYFHKNIQCFGSFSTFMNSQLSKFNYFNLINFYEPKTEAKSNYPGWENYLNNYIYIFMIEFESKNLIYLLIIFKHHNLTVYNFSHFNLQNYDTLGIMFPISRNSSQLTATKLTFRISSENASSWMEGHS